MTTVVPGQADTGHHLRQGHGIHGANERKGLGINIVPRAQIQDSPSLINIVRSVISGGSEGLGIHCLKKDLPHLPYPNCAGSAIIEMSISANPGDSNSREAFVPYRSHANQAPETPISLDGMEESVPKNTAFTPKTEKKGRRPEQLLSSSSLTVLAGLINEQRGRDDLNFRYEHDDGRARLKKRKLKIVQKGRKKPVNATEKVPVTRWSGRCTKCQKNGKGANYCRTVVCHDSPDWRVDRERLMQSGYRNGRSDPAVLETSRKSVMAGEEEDKKHSVVGNLTKRRAFPKIPGLLDDRVLYLDPTAESDNEE